VRHSETVTGLTPLLGHASGFSWDEALLVMAPLAFIAGLLWLANRRAGRLSDSETGEDPQEAPR
jgi:cyanate permease